MGFCISLENRIDTSNAAAVEKRIFDEMEKNEGAPDFDASALTYISSAGLRILMKVKKKFMSQRLSINEVSPEVYEILENTGFTELFDVKKRRREISVDGCDIIGKGFYGTVYRLDDETIVKVFDPGVIEIWAKTESKTSVSIEVEAGGEYYVRCGVSVGFFVGHPSFDLVPASVGNMEYKSLPICKLF